MAITRTAMVDDDGSGTTGTILNNAWKQELYGQIDAALGVWADVPFNVANFPTQPAITAGQVTSNRYAVIGKTLFWTMQMNAAPGAVTPQLLIVVPGGLSISSAMAPLASGSDAGAFTPGFVGMNSATRIFAQKSTGTNWAGPVYVFFTATIALV